MEEYIYELINRMIDEQDSSNKFKAHREAASLNDLAYMPLIKNYITEHFRKKDLNQRKKAYFILINLLKHNLDKDYLQFYINRLSFEDNKYLISEMLDNFNTLQFDISEDVSIQPMLDLALNEKWQIRHSAINALGSFHLEDSRKMLRYYICQTDEKKYKYEIIYANSAMGKIGTKDDISQLEIHINSRSRDIRDSADFAVKRISEREQ